MHVMKTEVLLTYFQIFTKLPSFYGKYLRCKVISFCAVLLNWTTNNFAGYIYLVMKHNETPIAISQHVLKTCNRTGWVNCTWSWKR